MNDFDFAVKFDGDKWVVVKPIIRIASGDYASFERWSKQTQEKMDVLKSLLEGTN